MSRRIVYLFPDTGHHYYFTPIGLPPGLPDPMIRDMESVVGEKLLRNNTELVKLAENQRQWQTTRDRPWLRWRYGKRSYFSDKYPAAMEIYGIWLAVETNLGDRSRGYEWVANHHPDQNDPAWSAFRKKEAQGEEDLSPYYRTRSALLPRSDLIDLSKDLDLKKSLPSIGDTKLEFEIVWPDHTGEVIPVHLVVDFGNARTIVLALEERPVAAHDSLRQICRPLQFGHSLEDSGKINFSVASRRDPSDAKSPPQAAVAAHEQTPANQVADSWFVLREPPFSGDQFAPELVSMDEFNVEIQTTPPARYGARETTRKVLRTVYRRIPQMFVELSPALIGPEAAEALADADLSLGGHCYMSSPKRYLWDTDRVGTGGGAFWTMLPGSDRPPDPHHLPRKLAGEMLRFLPERHARRDIEDPTAQPPPVEWEDLEERPDAKPRRPNFSRADSLIWTALAILERGARQINSEAFRRGFQGTIPRRLASVTITRPSGWTRGEIKAYWAAWREARNIFYWSRERYWDNSLPYPEWQGRSLYPELDMRLDEGIASQLALVYSEIRHLGQCGRDWIALFGRRRGDSDSIRVMTIDIGGGSTDTSIVEYRDTLTQGIGSHLTPRVLFNDSSAFAGDQLALNIIEEALLPTIGAAFKNDQVRQQRFSDALMPRDEADKFRLSLITRMVFLPMIHRWLDDFEQQFLGNQAQRLRWSPVDSGASRKYVEEFNDRMKGERVDVALPADDPFGIDYGLVDKIINRWALRIADKNARILAAFQCDLVVVTGKPSELPQLKTIMKQYLPVHLHRILFAHKYFAGDWFPCAPADLAIPDAKMVTAAGAALFTAVTCDAMRLAAAPEGEPQEPLLRNFRLHDVTEHQEPARNFWGRMGHDTRVMGPNNVVLRLDQEQSEVLELTHTTLIGRARFPGMDVEPVYEFRVRRPEATQGPIRARLLRVTRDGDFVLPTEELKLEVVGAANGQPVGPNDVELKLRTLPSGEEHWLDRGRFEIRWETQDEKPGRL